VKTTIELSDNLFVRARQLAQKERKTLRALVEEGLALALDEHEHRRAPKIKPVVFAGQGLSDEFRQVSWQRMREAIYPKGGG
jgi:predicted transcriptional regulator